MDKVFNELKDAAGFTADLFGLTIWFILMGIILGMWAYAKIERIAKERRVDSQIMNDLDSYQRASTQKKIPPEDRAQEYMEIYKSKRSHISWLFYKYLISHKDFSNIVAALSYTNYCRVTGRKKARVFNVWIFLLLVWTGFVALNYKTVGFEVAAFEKGFFSATAITGLIVPAVLLLTQIVIAIILFYYRRDVKKSKVELIRNLADSATDFFEPLNPFYDKLALEIAEIVNIPNKKHDRIIAQIKKEGLVYRKELRQKSDKKTAKNKVRNHKSKKTENKNIQKVENEKLHEAVKEELQPVKEELNEQVKENIQEEIKEEPIREQIKKTDTTETEFIKQIAEVEPAGKAEKMDLVEEAVKLVEPDTKPVPETVTEGVNIEPQSAAKNLVDDNNAVVSQNRTKQNYETIEAILRANIDAVKSKSENKSEFKMQPQSERYLEFKRNFYAELPQANEKTNIKYKSSVSDNQSKTIPQIQQIKNTVKDAEKIVHEIKPKAKSNLGARVMMPVKPSATSITEILPRTKQQIGINKAVSNEKIENQVVQTPPAQITPPAESVKSEPVVTSTTEILTSTKQQTDEAVLNEKIETQNIQTTTAQNAQPAESVQPTQVHMQQPIRQTQPYPPQVMQVMQTQAPEQYMQTFQTIPSYIQPVQPAPHIIQFVTPQQSAAPQLTSDFMNELVKRIRDEIKEDDKARMARVRAARGTSTRAATSAKTVTKSTKTTASAKADKKPVTRNTVSKDTKTTTANGTRKTTTKTAASRTSSAAGGVMRGISKTKKKKS